MTEDEKWDSIDSELEPSPADEREEAYRERKDAELDHEKKQDEGIIQANRRAVLAGVLGGTAAGGGILYGLWDQSGKDIEGSRQPSSSDVGNEQTPTKTPRNDYERTSTRTETDTPTDIGYPNLHYTDPALREIQQEHQDYFGQLEEIIALDGDIVTVEYKEQTDDFVAKTSPNEYTEIGSDTYELLREEKQ
ncbi:MAG: hypothetical protein BRC28_01500 [Nanohaloarchaea archaeon SW_4_43_9]|nr:MAG: hypothetical protein BRC28_01500 [Nanohaloarchaea archaeon SW_4_43_9]